MKRILHCVLDEKFIDSTIYVCDTILTEYTHTFAVFSNTTNINFKYIKNGDRVNCWLSSDFIKYVNEQYDIVIIHSLASVPFYKIHQLSRNIKVVWIAWGYDIYTFPHPEFPFVEINLYRKLTKKLINLTIKSYLQRKHGLFHTIYEWNKIKRNISRIDYFSGIIPEEYDLMCRNSFFKAKRVQWHYTLMQNKTQEKLSCNSNNILIGNSADPSNNHADIMYAIKDILSLNSKVIMPLSYGGTPDYKRNIINLGYQLFEERFIPILDFMPIDEYSYLISSCRNVIMGHERQQAIGNINMSLRIGCRVFLYKSSMNYKYYKSLGFKIFAIEDELCQLSNLSKDNYELYDNLVLVKTRMSNDCYFDTIKKMFAIITEE